MRTCIHRGTAEVGGSCVELEQDGWRVVLDLGLPLEVTPDEEVVLPRIPGLREPNDRTAVAISHGHPDHHGLHDQLHADVPLFIGADAQRVLAAASFFTGQPAPPAPTRPLRDREPIAFGPFTITPYLADHSGFDAYSLLVEANGRRLFYSGDIRAHGRKPGAFHRLVGDPPKGVNVLLLEGTRLGPADDRPQLSERDVELRVAEQCEEARGAVLACYSPQNVDRLVTLFRAAKRSGREFVMDLYAATVAAATDRETIPRANWDGVRVYLPHSQRRRVIEQRAFHLTDAVRAHRVYPEELGERPGDFMLTFRASMARELQNASCLDGATCLWSMWKGYLERNRGRELGVWLAERQIPLRSVHASGHAPVGKLKKLAQALAPCRVVPIHTAAADSFPDAFERVEIHADGERWSV